MIRNDNKLTMFTVLLLLFMITVSFADSSASVVLWPRGDVAYVCSGSAMPIWPELPDEAIGCGKFLQLSVEMPVGFEISAYGKSTLFAMQPKPLVIPLSMTSSVSGDKIEYLFTLPVPPITGSPKLALLVDPGDMAQGSYPMTIGLKSIDGVLNWADNSATIEVIEPLAGVRPKRVQVAIYDYADYVDQDYKDGMTEIYRKSGTNYLHNMAYYSSTDTIAQRLKGDGVKAGWVWFWSKHTRAITNEYPEAKQRNNWGDLIYDTLCYTWCIENREIAVDLLTEYIRQSDTPKKYECIINDNEERAVNDNGTPAGDLYTPITLEAFRSFAGIDASVVLTSVKIATDYIDQWIEFRCWQCAEMADILGEAIKAYDSEMLYGLYSGYKYTGIYTGHTKKNYSVDWDLMADVESLDFGNAGYYGQAYVTTTVNAIAPKAFVHGEMYINNFLTQPDPPIASDFFYTLMYSIYTGGGKGGVGVWYGQVLDGAGFLAVSKTAELTAQVEDYLLDGQRCDSELNLPGNLYSNYIYAYKISDDKRLVTVFNPYSYSINVTLSWKTLPDGLETIELQSSQMTSDPKVMSGIIPARSMKVFETTVVGPGFCGDVGTVYLDGDLNEDCKVDFADFSIMVSQWLADSSTSEDK